MFMETEIKAMMHRVVQAQTYLGLAWHEGYPSGYVEDFEEKFIRVWKALDSLEREMAEWYRQKKGEEEA